MQISPFLRNSTAFLSKLLHQIAYKANNFLLKSNLDPDNAHYTTPRTVESSEASVQKTKQNIDPSKIRFTKKINYDVVFKIHSNKLCVKKREK